MKLLLGDWMDPQPGKSLNPPGIQQVASHFTDCAALVYIHLLIIGITHTTFSANVTCYNIIYNISALKVTSFGFSWIP
jgi:hypothetical protein